ncbi:MAG: response regulator [Deltaproteobacteria bacterium]|nr:response regulator [Deltaproteobacteria bacterium]
MVNDGLDLIILDDEQLICDYLARYARRFYTWGEVHAFTDPIEAKTFCFQRGSSLAIFVIDVFLGNISAFDFVESIGTHYPLAPEDTIIISGQADDDVVNMCVAAGVNCLLEKPLKPYGFQFAVRAIARKYLTFAKKLMQDPSLAAHVERLG